MHMQMGMSYVFAVVVTGLVVVFLGLVLLIAFINLIGTVFKKLNSKPAAAPAPKAVPAPPGPAPAKPVQTSTDEDEVVSAIMAAVAMMGAADGKAYRVRSVKPVNGNASRSAWASAGLRDMTSPF